MSKVAPIWFLTDYPISDILVPIPIQYFSISLTLTHLVSTQSPLS